MQKKLLRMAVLSFFSMIFMAVSPTGAEAQRDGRDWCSERSSRQDRDRFCEIREETIDAVGSTLTVDAGPNGGVSVIGWDRDEVLVRAKIVTRARNEEDAEDLASEISIDYDGVIGADGPRTSRRESWSVSFEIFAPRNQDLDLESVNGGISITDIDGEIEFETTNGGVHLENVAGDVRGRTTNGRLHIELDGDTWQGSGMDVRTQNGGVTLLMPEDYSAHLITRTVNGGYDIDFPITVRGRIGRRSNIETDIGDGGPTIRAVTTNGGVRISQY